MGDMSKFTFMSREKEEFNTHLSSDGFFQNKALKSVLAIHHTDVTDKERERKREEETERQR